MGELAEYFATFKEAKREYRASIEPGRVEFARKQLAKAGLDSEYDEYNKCLVFKFRGASCKIFPFTGWWTGKGIGSNRGIKKLIKRIREIEREGKDANQS